jgi:hypothetical protein
VLPKPRAAPLPTAAGAPEHAAAATGQSHYPRLPKTPARLPGTRPDHRPASRKQAARKDILYALKRCDLPKVIRWCRLVVSTALATAVRCPEHGQGSGESMSCPYTQINTICESLKRDGSSRMTAQRRLGARLSRGLRTFGNPGYSRAGRRPGRMFMQRPRLT